LQWLQGYWLNRLGSSDVIILKNKPIFFKTEACGDLVWSNCGGVHVAEFNDSQIKRFNIYPSNTILNITSDSAFESITLRNLVG
jgi:hypothetical protein